MEINKNWTPFFIAVAVGLVAVTYYVFSGRSSYDLQVRELGRNGSIEQVNSVDPQKIQIKCKNGENYEIVFRENQDSYENLIFNACGPEGTHETE